MTAPPSDQPATPAAALRMAAGRIDPGPHDAHLDTDPLQEAYDDARRHYAADLRRWADELDAAPATYQLPAEPPAQVDKLWDRTGLRWDRDGTDAKDGYRFWRSERGWIFHYPELLMRQGPLSTAPPTDAEEASA